MLAALRASRRAIIGAATAAVLTSNASAITSSESDPELLALASEYRTVDCEITRLCQNGATEAAIERKMRVWRSLVRRISSRPASSNADLRLKTEIALGTMNATDPDSLGDPPWEQRIMRSLCRDILQMRVKCKG